VQATIEAADTYLSPEDAAVVRDNLPDVTRQTPRTKIAAHLVLKAFAKGGHFAGDIFKATATVFATEEAKAIIMHGLPH
jgi:hypothetical protein